MRVKGHGNHGRSGGHGCGHDDGAAAMPGQAARPRRARAFAAAAVLAGTALLSACSSVPYDTSLPPDPAPTPTPLSSAAAAEIRDGMCEDAVAEAAARATRQPAPVQTLTAVYVSGPVAHIEDPDESCTEPGYGRTEVPKNLYMCCDGTWVEL